MTRTRLAIVFGTLLALNAAVLVAAPAFGPEPVDWRLLFRPTPADADPMEAFRAELAWSIIVGYRLPRVVFGLLAGACLALSGAVFQATLRNDLATPYTLGVSGGSALGALLALKVGAAGFWVPPLASLAGALVCAATIAALAKSRARSRRGALDAASILLAGVAINFLCGAGVMLVQYLSDPHQTYAAIRWLMGGLDIGGRWEPALALGAAAVPVGGALCLGGRTLNALNLGEASAHSLGVEAGRARAFALVGGGILTALCVAFAGPIGFVGLAAPHAARMLLGPDNRLVLPASALAGAAFLAGCDAAGRAFFRAEAPAGLATALLGGPFFLWLLFRRG